MATMVGANDLGESFAVGDTAFSHYTMRAGMVGEPDAQGWFRFLYTDGGSDLLDATRICTLSHAERMGWL